ncbi:ferredoxin [Halocatena pleomorpha]|uniref:Ferredoxin n=1 Tax=Halocatena pleomorpha TaxID=1785090 RepID=A0A3P3RJM0_9EURY|nr:ferredoxin [Halocatena pleomorpha]RRJ33711.1 ferredoxin [Halocatena pleomorpha]
MSTEYHIRIDRTACVGVFACLVRDDRFEEAPDGLVTIERADGSDEQADETIARFSDDRLADARLAARACPVDAIDVTVIDDA